MTQLLCFTGMDAAEKTELHNLFAAAGKPGGFELGDESQADVLVIDIDSVHGHMTWLRAHSGHSTVVALSNRESPKAEWSLVRPVDAAALASLLRRVAQAPDEAGEAGEVPGSATPVPTPEAAAGERGADAPAPAATPASVADAPGNEDLPAGTAAADIGGAHVAAAVTPAPGPAPDAAPRRLPDYLRPGALDGPSRLQLEGAPALVVDPASASYVGPAQLKGFLAYACAEEIRPEAWQPLSGPELERALPGTAERHSWNRLIWLCGLVSGPAHARGRYRLTRWPQIEREYPRHFRIATVMMKDPATPAQIAEAAGVPESEVIEFVNASLATGQAEQFVEPEAPAAAPRGGFLDRIKGLRGS